MAVVAGCGESPSSGPSGPHRLYQVTAEDLSSANAVELDGSKVADNLGKALELVRDQGLGDPQAATDQAFTTGSLALVVDVQGASSSSSKSAPAAVNTYAGGAAAYDPTSPAQPPLAGTADGLLVTAGPGDLAMTIAPFGMPLPVVLHGAQVQLIAGAEKLQAVVAGGVDPSFVSGTLIPSWQLVVATIVARDCSTRTPPDCGCTAHSPGGDAIALLDQTRDCVITADELANSSIVQSATSPDLTIDGRAMLSFSLGIEADFAAQR